MTPDKVCELLSKIGAKVSRRTLLHYEELKLIPKATRGGGGRQGRFSDYPEETVYEAFAAWSLLHGKYGKSFHGGPVPKISPASICHFREAYLMKIDIDSAIASISEEDHIALSAKEISEADMLAFEKEETDRIERMSEHERLTEEWKSLRSESILRIGVGFGGMWESEKVRAKALLIKACENEDKK